MTAVWYRFRAELRRQWRALLSLAVLVGIAGGATIGALAGARRTDSAYPRLLRDTEAWDVLVNPDLGADSALDADAVARLPQVVQAGRVDGVSLTSARLDSRSDVFFDAVVLASDGTAGFSFARPKILHGHMPAPDRPHDVFVNPIFARRSRLGVGDHLDVYVLTSAALARFEANEFTSRQEVVDAARSGALGERARLRITAVGVMPDDIVLDEGFQNAQMLLTPAFRARHPDAGMPYWGEVVRLARGPRDVAAFRRAVEALVPNEALAFQTQRNTTAKVDRAVRPDVGALVIFAVVVGLTGLLLVGQALARQTLLDSVDHRSLGALGFTRLQLGAVNLLRGAVVASAGAAVAVALAIVGSPLTPIGPARTAEPDPGVAFDGTALGAGAAAAVLVVVALAAVAAWRSMWLHAGAASASGTPSRVTQLLARSGAPVPVVAGVRMALEPGRGRTAVPARTTIVSAFLALASVAAAGVFASSLDHLVTTPRLYGWNWDVQMAISTFDPVVTEHARGEVAAFLDGSRAVRGWASVSLSDVRLARGSVPALGIDPGRRSVGPTVVSGRLPRDDNEIALGQATLRQLGASVGDRITARANDGRQERLKVVGRVVLPGLGLYPGSDKTALGEGAVVTQRAVKRLGPHFERADFLVAFRDVPAASRRAVVRKAGTLASSTDVEGFEFATVRRPSDVLAYEHVRLTPVVLATVLASLAMATIAHALVTTVHRRRRELALFGTLGFTRRQISSTVAWQATTVGIVALVIGIPLGIVAGRWMWSALADDLGTPSEPRIPLLAMLAGLPTFLLLVNAVAFVPGRLAARLRPAAVLRSE